MALPNIPGLYRRHGNSCNTVRSSDTACGITGFCGEYASPIREVARITMIFTLMEILAFKVAPFNFYMDYLRWFSIFEIIGMSAVLSLVVGLNFKEL